MENQGIYTDYLTQKQVQAYIKCSKSFVVNKRKSGEIKFLKIGKKVLFPKTAIDNWLNSNKQEVTNGQ